MRGRRADGFSNSPARKELATTPAPTSMMSARMAPYLRLVCWRRGSSPWRPHGTEQDVANVGREAGWVRNAASPDQRREKPSPEGRLPKTTLRLLSVRVFRCDALVPASLLFSSDGGHTDKNRSLD